MPPKGRKRAAVKGPTPKKTAAAKHSADASPATPPATPSNTKSFTSPEPSKSDTNLASAAQSPETTPAARQASSRARKPTAKAVSSKSPVEVVSPVQTSDTPSEVITDAVPTVKISETNDETTERGGDLVSQDATLVEKAPETAAGEADAPVLENVAGTPVEKAPETPAGEAEAPVAENVAGTVAEAISEGTTTKTGTKTVVRKTVRVVKKIVKRKVPKKVQKDQPVSVIEESGKIEAENPNPNVLEAMEVEEAKTTGPDSMEVDKSEVEPNNHASVVVENPNSDDGLLVDANNPKADSNTISLVVEKPNVDVSNSVEPDVAEEKEDEVLDLVEDKNNSEEEPHSVSTEPKVIPDEGQEDEADPKNVDSEGGQGVEGLMKEVVDGGSKEEVGTVDGIPLSGEMEALERRRKRKTEIFIGGLDKDAKEEDVRKVFQEVGEISELRVVMNDKTGKNKGFGFVRYASADDAKKALTKFAKVEICGKQCSALPAQGNDTIFLGNIDKKWKTEDVLKLLQGIGIDKIDNVTVVPDPNKLECNRGFAFLELETNRDAQTAYRKLQQNVSFGKNHKIKVAWAEPLSEPDEEEMLKVKSVYAEYLPSSWDEDKVKDYFNRFGEVENVVLAKNLSSAKRKDFAFVNYKTREAALACIEAFNRGAIADESSKVNVKVSLAKPVPKGRQGKHVSGPTSKEPLTKKPKPAQSILRPHQPASKVRPVSSTYDNFHANRSQQPANRSSTTSELVHLLREQASWRQQEPNLGPVDREYPSSSAPRKRPLSVVGDDAYFSDSRGYPRARFGSSFPAVNPSYNGLPRGLAPPSLPYYHQPPPSHPTGSFNRDSGYPNSFQARGVPPSGNSGLYPRYPRY